jgi:hypothetical protein
LAKESIACKAKAICKKVIFVLRIRIGIGTRREIFTPMSQFKSWVNSLGSSLKIQDRYFSVSVGLHLRAKPSNSLTTKPSKLFLSHYKNRHSKKGFGSENPISGSYAHTEQLL